VGLFDGDRQRFVFSIGISLRFHLVLGLGLLVASGCVIPQVRVLLLVHVELGPLSVSEDLELIYALPTPQEFRSVVLRAERPRRCGLGFSSAAVTSLPPSIPRCSPPDATGVQSPPVVCALLPV
jgi:hypothetical protein